MPGDHQRYVREDIPNLESVAVLMVFTERLAVIGGNHDRRAFAPILRIDKREELAGVFVS